MALSKPIRDEGLTSRPTGQARFMPGGLDKHMLNMAKTSAKVEPMLFSTSRQTEADKAKAWLSGRLRTGSHTMFSEVVDLTPELATLLLAINPADQNRKLKDNVVAKYATDMREGAWQINGESIKLSRDGFLNDGQHRCSAAVSCGVTVKTMITFGCERESRLTLDQNAIRTPGDYLGMNGVESSNHAAAVAGSIWQHEKRNQISGQNIYRPTRAQLQEAFHTHPGVSDSIRTAHRKGAGLVGGVTTLAFCHYIFSRKNPGAADHFIDRLIVGDNLPTKDPIFLCRQRLLGDKRMTIGEKVELIFRAWNLHRKGKKQNKLQLAGGDLPAIEG